MAFPHGVRAVGRYYHASSLSIDQLLMMMAGGRMSTLVAANDVLYCVCSSDVRKARIIRRRQPAFLAIDVCFLTQEARRWRHEPGIREWLLANAGQACAKVRAQRSTIKGPFHLIGLRGDPPVHLSTFGPRCPRARTPAERYKHGISHVIRTR